MRRGPTPIRRRAARTPVETALRQDDDLHRVTLVTRHLTIARHRRFQQGIVESALDVSPQPPLAKKGSGMAGSGYRFRASRWRRIESVTSAAPRLRRHVDASKLAIERAFSERSSDTVVFDRRCCRARPCPLRSGPVSLFHPCTRGRRRRPLEHRVIVDVHAEPVQVAVSIAPRACTPGTATSPLLTRSVVALAASFCSIETP